MFAQQQRTIYRLFGMLNTLEGVLAFLALFEVASEHESAVLLGLSLPRLILAGGVLLAVLLFAFWTLKMFLDVGWVTRLEVTLKKWLVASGWLLPAACALGIMVIWSGWLLIVFNSGLSYPLGIGLRSVYARTKSLWIWGFLISLQALLALVVLNSRKVWQDAWGNIAARWRSFRTVLLLALLAATEVYAADLIFGIDLYRTFYDYFFPLTLLIILLSWLHQFHPEKTWYRSILIALVIFFVTLIFYHVTTFVVGRPNTPGKAYFHELAEAYLQGRLYLEEPSQTHDLTFHNGHWYVANPPLVALLMIPWVALRGADTLNTVVFSILFGALNSVLVFMILQEASQRGWTKLNTSDNLWLTVMFAFGSVHWYIAIIGKMWFMSQIVTVTFLAIAVLLAMKKAPAWLCGVSLGLAMVARPNILLAFPLLFGITAQLMQDEWEKLDYKKLTRWTVRAVIPLFLVVLGLMWYNYARFGDPFDYGYLNENVADFMAGDLKNYGTFHPHFISRNLRVMLFGLPVWKPECGKWAPQVSGMSIFLTTPALLYLVRSFRRTPLVIGAWSAVLFLVGLLANYYNTGAWQYGYKYLLDFIVPIMILMGIAAGQRVSWLMRVLILIGVGMSVIGISWWFGFWCNGTL
jgi:hypothetical protein